MRKSRLAFASVLAAAATASLAAATPAAAQMRVGTLQCNISGGLGIVVGSSRDVNCLFTPARGRQQAYAGTLNNIGLDVGASTPGMISFAVVGAGPAGSLAGSYSGPGLGVTLGGTIGGNSLVSSSGVTLQPLEGGLRNGIGISAGIGSVTLQPTQTVYRSGRRQM